VLAATASLLQTVGTIVATCLAIGAGIGAAIAVGRSRLAQTTIQLLSTQNEAFKNENERQAREITDLRGRLQVEKVARTSQDKEIANLKEMVQGTKAIAALTSHLDERLDELVESIRGGGS
jgi:predicted RNase H-like nuclease (RuvC/YqgF family)